jgi:hypothetical protein
VQLASQFADASRLASQPDGGALDASDLDLAWAAWRKSLPSDSDRIAQDLDAFGAAFGELLVHDLGFEWLHCTDDYGSGLAVVALRGSGDLTIFPSDFVAKRHDRAEGPFFADAVLQIRATIDETKAEWAAKKPPQ